MLCQDLTLLPGQRILGERAMLMLSKHSLRKATEEAQDVIMKFDAHTFKAMRSSIAFFQCYKHFNHVQNHEVQYPLMPVAGRGY